MSRTFTSWTSVSKFFAALSVCGLVGGSLWAGDIAKPQSTARPYNLPIVSQVQVARSDARADAFFKNYIPTLRQIINSNLKESVPLSNVSSLKLDANKLFLRQQAKDVIRVYFLAEGAGYRNSLGFAFTPAGSQTAGTPYLVFPDFYRQQENIHDSRHGRRLR